MNHPSRLTTISTLDQLKSRILDALPGAVVEVSGGGGHFTIAVEASQFEGKNTLAKQRLVYSAIKDLMAGDNAPVHAVDELKTTTPSGA